jgi:hypothetical protein
MILPEADIENSGVICQLAMGHLKQLKNIKTEENPPSKINILHS